MNFRADVYVWLPDGEVCRLSPGDGIYYQPCIRPDGAEVVFSGNASGPPQIWRASTVDSKIETITEPTNGARHPVYSWDGSLIAFTSDRATGEPPQAVEAMPVSGVPERGNIFVVDFEGGGLVQVTEGPFSDQRPCFSPDGSTIVFVSNRSGAPALWSVPTDGGVAPQQLPYAEPAYRPWYSVDGGWIFFIILVGRHQICRVKPYGTEAERLLNDDRGQSHGPFADPAGEVLLMHSTRGGDRYGIWELPLDGAEPRKFQPPGIESATHATRSRNRVVAFDVISGI